MIHLKTRKNRPLAFIPALVIWISAVLILASSHTMVEATTAVRVQAATQVADIALAQPQLPSGTPASMNYHDEINVSAIAIAAYER